MDVVMAALLKDVAEEMRHRAEEGCTGTHDVTCCGEDSDIHPEEWCNRCLMGVAVKALASLHAPALANRLSDLALFCNCVRDEMVCFERWPGDARMWCRDCAIQRASTILASLPAPAAPCANCGHVESHNGPAGDIADGCTHAGCNCGFDSRPAAPEEEQ